MNALTKSLLATLVGCVLASPHAVAAGSAFQLNPLTQPLNGIAPRPPSYQGPAPGVSTNPQARKIAEFLRANAKKPASPAPTTQSTSGNWATLAPRQQGALQQLYNTAGPDARVRIRPESGTPIEIRGDALEPRNPRQPNAFADLDAATAQRFLRIQNGLLRITDPDNELILVDRQTDDLGRKHFRYVPHYRGLEVWPGELSVHLNPAGDVDRMNGAYIPTPDGVPVTPQCSAVDAVMNTRQYLGVHDTAVVTDPELIVYGPLLGEPRLAWKFDLTGAIDHSWRCVVDALSGEVLLTVSLICHAAEAGSGIDSLGQQRALNVWQDGTTYFLVDSSKAMYDPSSAPPNLDNSRGVIVVLDAKNTPPNDRPQQVDQLVHSTSASATSGWVPDAVSAAFGLSETYDYYGQQHQRNSLDGKGGTIVGIVRFGVNYPNAFWNGKAMFFGDGFTKSIDVTGHELTHGVISSVGESGILVYHNQPGALNEALADIYGEMVEEFAFGQLDWLKGDQLDGPPIQNYADPNSIDWAPGRPNPARMSQFVQLPDNNQGDNGGVHINSSIINHAYYLMAEGLGATSIGTTDTSKIFYRTMTTHLQKESQFIDMRHGCIASAEELFGQGSAQAQATIAAFDAVEIFDAPTAPEPSPIPVVEGEDATLFLAYGEWGDGPYLIRKDPALADGEFGTALYTVDFLSETPVSVSGDGTYATYVTQDFDLGLIDTADDSTASLLGEPGLVYSVAMSPDGNRFAFVLMEDSEPTSELYIFDLLNNQEWVVPLYVPLLDGERLDIVLHADVLDFMPNGQVLFYDAYSEFTTQDGYLIGSWTLFALDLNTDTIQMLINLEEGLNFANPSLGHARNHLLTFEVINKDTGLSEVYTANLQTGDTHLVTALSSPGELAYPCYLGDESGLVYTLSDAETGIPTYTGYSLAGLPLADDGMTPQGNPGLWIEDGGLGVIYRRGTYVGQNQLPEVTLTQPSGNLTLPAPATVAIHATANDADGTVAKVQFYNGSSFLSEDTAAPYEFNWQNIPVGQYRIIARASDNLGATTDSPPITLTVIAEVTPPQLRFVRLNTEGKLEFQVEGQGSATFEVQASSNLLTWDKIADITVGPGLPTFTDPASGPDGYRFYRLFNPN